MKKSSRLLPPIVAIILVTVVTVVLVAVFPDLFAESFKGADGYFPSVEIARAVKFVGYIGQFIFATGGFVSLLISVKWLIETIFAIKSKD